MVGDHIMDSYTCAGKHRKLHLPNLHMPTSHTADSAQFIAFKTVNIFQSISSPRANSPDRPPQHP